MMKVILVALALSGGCFFASAQTQVAIIPQPVSLELKDGSSKLPAQIHITAMDSRFTGERKFLQSALQAKGYIASATATPQGQVFLKLLPGKNSQAGYYELETSAKGISISARNAEGIFYGIQTLLQLLPQAPGEEMAHVWIKDYPRFDYRGLHLDVGRHFFPVAMIKKYIDYMATYKLNRFHWHLTEDQGWRIEIKKYPRLTSVGGYRNGTIIGRFPGTGNDGIRYGGFYTQNEVKEIVRYATARHIEVIPEIEMPGHASAAIAAYPQLSCFPNEDTQAPKGTTWAGSQKGKQVQQTWGVFEDVFSPSEYTFKFLENVLDEVIPLFPSTYIHIGGDECPKEAWKRSEFCQQLIKKYNLKDEHGLQSYFIQRMEKYINKKGKKIIGWDEILEGGLAPNAAVMSWRGEEGGIAAAKENHDVIMTPTSWMYFDYSQSSSEDSVTIGGYVPLEKVYSYEPVPNVLDAGKAKYILGAQANMWTEYMKNWSKVEYMLFPRLLALSEVQWTAKENKNWTAFEKKLPAAISRLKAAGINYSNAYFGLQSSLGPAQNNEGLLWTLTSKMNSPISINFNNGDSVWSYTAPQWIRPGVTVVNATADGVTFSQKLSFNKATGRAITLVTPASKGYPGNGAFTLVDGVISDKGLLRSKDILGFSGSNMEAIIDLGKSMPVQNVTLYAFEQKPSWIHPPASVDVLLSEDGITYHNFGSTNSSNTQRFLSYAINGNDQARFVKVIARPLGIIPEGQAGAGKPAWLMVHEIAVN